MTKFYGRARCLMAGLLLLDGFRARGVAASIGASQ